MAVTEDLEAVGGLIIIIITTNDETEEKIQILLGQHATTTKR